MQWLDRRMDYAQHALNKFGGVREVRTRETRHDDVLVAIGTMAADLQCLISTLTFYSIVKIVLLDLVDKRRR